MTNSMKYKISRKARAWRVSGKGSEKVEVSSPLSIRGDKKSGFCPKVEEKLLKGFVQEQGTGMYVQSFCAWACARQTL